MCALVHHSVKLAMIFLTTIKIILFLFIKEQGEKIILPPFLNINHIAFGMEIKETHIERCTLAYNQISQMFK
jgi:hypothetical protein